jgi:hypothetical protein
VQKVSSTEFVSRECRTADTKMKSQAAKKEARGDPRRSRKDAEEDFAKSGVTDQNRPPAVLFRQMKQ